jgi:hypothetical protein
MHEILEENEYYPFGMTFGKPNSISGTRTSGGQYGDVIKNKLSIF